MKYRRIGTFLLSVLLLAMCCLPALAAEEGSVAFSDFNGKTIAIQTGTIYVDNVHEFLSDTQEIYGTTVNDCILAVQNGKADGALTDEPVARYAASTVEGAAVVVYDGVSDEMAFVTAKSSLGEKYQSELSEFLQKMDESGMLTRLQEKWIDGKEERICPDYESLPATNGVLKIATDPSYAPFEYIDNGRIVGFEPEILYEFCLEYGYQPLFITSDFGGIIAGITSGKYDIGSSGFTVTEERKETVNFSYPILICGAGMMYMKDGSGRGENILQSAAKSFMKTFVAQNRWKEFAAGIRVTADITVSSLLLGTLLGFVMHLLCRRGGKFFNAFAAVLSWLLEGLPVVVFLMILYYIVFGKTDLAGETVAILGFTLTFACAVHGMLRMGENALDPGQAVAARAMGYSDGKAYFKILLPQSVPHFLPSYLSEVSGHIKATAVVGYIAVVDVTKVGDLIRGSTYEPFFPLLAVAVMYFVMAGLLKLLIKMLGKRTDPYGRSEKNILRKVMGK